MDSIALLSNTNVNPIIDKISKEDRIYKPTGYGNVFEELLNVSSGLNRFNPNVIFIFIDLSELIVNCFTEENIRDEINNWFDNFRKCINPKVSYFIFDADLRESAVTINVTNYNFYHFENIWNEKLENLTQEKNNVYIFPYKNYINEIGKNKFYSPKLWFLGRIAISEEGRQAIVCGICDCLNLLNGETKKVLILDLDNTLWGGLAGENDNSPIQLSNEHVGLIYKNFQRAIKRIKNAGILLAIVSKNNDKEALDIIKNNPHMVLKEEDFVSIKINWEQKDKNILEIAKELNLGLESFVFIDDNPTERELIKTVLPDVEVPDFPERPEHLPDFVYQIYTKYFKKLIFSSEDRLKTEQYQANIKRNQLKQNIDNFADYLKNLNIKVTQVKPKENSERLYQLLNKTNQFNLTTKRYTYPQISDLLEDADTIIYMFEVSDKFGNNGITAVVIVKVLEVPYIDSFILSCRIMGKFIENYILNLVEQDIKDRGFNILESYYYKTEKNAPVENLYDDLGYNIVEMDEKHKKYIIDLLESHKREYYINFTDGHL